MKRLMTITVLGAALATAAVAQQSAKQQPQRPASPDAGTTKQPADASPATPVQNSQQSAEQVLNELLKRRAENPLIEPARPAGALPATPAPTTAARPVGTAPTVASGAPLRREGQFVINRRARLVRTPATVGTADAPTQALPWMVVFDADSEGLQDPPMYVMPCQMLERAEAMAQQYGDSAVFLTSGQVYVYRGANYLLPTIMQLAHDRGNLQP